MSTAGTNGWNDRTVLTYLIISSVLLIAFLIVELRVADPVIDIRLFRRYTFTMAIILIWAITAVLYGGTFLMPFFFENVGGLSSATTGEIFISLLHQEGDIISFRLVTSLRNRVFPPTCFCSTLESQA